MSELKSWEEFFYAVETMRTYQKAYFAVRAPSTLIKAKQYEALVDACITERKERAAAKKQAELFGGSR
jgi:hypothetical protein